MLQQRASCRRWTSLTAVLSAVLVLGGQALAQITPGAVTGKALRALSNASLRGGASVPVGVAAQRERQRRLASAFANNRSLTASRARPAATSSGLSQGSIFTSVGMLGQGGYGGDGGPATQTGLTGPAGVAVDPAGNTYIADTQDNLIRKVPPATGANPNPNIELLAGYLPIGETSPINDSCGSELFNGNLPQPGCNLNGFPAVSSDLTQTSYLTVPSDVKVDADGDVYILDAGDQVVTVIYEGGSALKTVLGRLGTSNPKIGYMYTLAGTLDTPTIAPPTAASAGDSGPAVTNGGLPQFDGSGNPLPSATFGGQTYASTGEESANGPMGMALDAVGNIYVADTSNNTVRVIYESDPAPPILAVLGINPVKGNIYTVAGTYNINDPNNGGDGFNDCSALQATTQCGEGLLATSANLSFPTGVAVDGNGNIYIADQFDNVVRAVYVQGAVPGIASAVAGHLYTVAGDPTTLGQFITDANGYYHPSNTCIPSSANCGDGDLATTAQLYGPAAVALDLNGNIFITDSTNQVIRAIFVSGALPNVSTPSPGHLYTVAGTIAGAGFSDYPSQQANSCDFPDSSNNCGDGGHATGALLYNPSGIALDSSNNLYIADTFDEAIRQVVGIPTAVPQTITFPTISDITYSAATIALNATSSSGLPVSYSATGKVKVAGSTLTMTGAGPVTVTATQPGGVAADGLTYGPATQSVSFAIDPAPLTVTAANLSVSRGAPVPPDLSNPTSPQDYTITGYVHSSDASTVTGAPTLATTYQTSASVGATFPIVISAGTLASPDYTFTQPPSVFVNATLTVQGATAQSIDFPAIPNQAYGGSFTPNATALPVSSPARIVTFISSDPTVATVSASGTVLSLVGVGKVTITAEQKGDAAYAPARPVQQILNVVPASLVVSADNQRVVQGGTIPALTYSISGFVNGDTASTATSGAPALTAGATSNQPLGTYPITIASGSFAAPNYSPTYVNGILTIYPPTPQTITFTPPPTSVTYGVSAISLAATASSGLPVSYRVSGPAGLSGSTLQITGSGLVTVTATQAGGGSYGPAPSVARTIAVAQAVLTVTANSINNVPIGSPVPGLTYTIAGYVNGDTAVGVMPGTPTLTTTDHGALTPPGTYPINVDVSLMKAANYTFLPVNGSITILPGAPPDYTLTANPTSITMAPGQIQQITIFAVPTNGYVNEYDPKSAQGGISLGCGNLPSNVTCAFSPATLSVNGSSLLVGPQPAGGQLTTLTISTGNVSTAAFRSKADDQTKIVPGVLLLPGGIAGAILAFNRRRFAKRVHLRQWLVVYFLFAGLIGMSACGYSNTQNTSSFAKPGTNTIVINALGAASVSSPTGPTGNLAHSINLTIVIE